MPFTGLVVAEKEKQTFVVAVFQKSGGRKWEKVCSHGEQDSTAVPNFAVRSFCPCGNLVGECLPQTLLMRLLPLIPAAVMRQTKGGYNHAETIQHAPPQPGNQNPADRGRIRRLCRPAFPLWYEPVWIYPASHYTGNHTPHCYRVPGQWWTACRSREADLAALKFEVLQKVGEAVGNIQTNVRRLRSRAAGTERQSRRPAGRTGQGTGSHGKRWKVYERCPQVPFYRRTDTHSFAWNGGENRCLWMWVWRERSTPPAHWYLLQLCRQDWLARRIKPDLSDTLRKCRIGTAKFFYTSITSLSHINKSCQNESHRCLEIWKKVYTYFLSSKFQAKMHFFC